MDDCSEEQLSEELKTKRICRFCLSQEEPLSDIFASITPTGAGGSKTAKTTTPLTLQIMACVSIEVYKDDGMPSTICDNCRHLMDHSYRFKQICKKADTLLKSYPITGVWPEKLHVPVNLFKTLSVEAAPKPSIRYLPVQEKSPSTSNATKIGRVVTKSAVEHHAAPSTASASSVEQYIVTGTPNETRLQIGQVEEDVKPKIVKLSIEDLRNIKQGKSISKANLLQKTSPASKRSETNSTKASATGKSLPEKRSPVKIINGSLGSASKAPVILNSMKPPNKTEEHIVQTSDGTLEIVCIESPQEPAPEPVNPMKTAPPVETHVYPCTECERTFPLRQLLEIHQQNHNRERNYPCEMCDRRFFSKYDLSKHNLTHTGERPFVCIICKAAFSRSTLLTRHQKIHKDQPKFLCMYCERTFLSNEELQKHMEFHKKKRPFQCQKCPKTFAYKQGLERHEVTHETNLPFPCEHCDLSFASASKLARHLTAHAGARPYPCRMCLRSFMLSHHLTRHVRSHQGGKGAYKCNECAAMFDNQDDLIYHSAEHATQSLTCPLCRERFETLEQVTEHIKEHSEGIQFACDYCDLLFTTEQKLDDHCQQEHLAVLAMERTEMIQNTTDESDSAQQFVIEEISIEKDGSQTITTFVDGKEKEKKFIQKDQVFKSEIVLPDIPVRTEEEYNEEACEGEEYYDEEELDDEMERASNDITIKDEKLEPVSKPPEKQVTKSSPVDNKKSTLQKLQPILKSVTPLVTATAPKTVGEVLKNLPKGMVVKRPIVPPTATATTNEKKADPTPAVETSPSPSTPKPAMVQKKLLPYMNAKQPPQTPLAKSTPIKPIETTKATTRSSSKRPAEDTKSPSPVKKVAVEATSTKTSPSTTVPTPKPVLKPVPKPGSSMKKSKTFEMKIGDKMVKVQKVVMTKAEVAAMARDGKIEMQGDTMILKQGKAKK
ncbi:zinc finger protein pita [Aedes albopictus]|uniref:Uncharacterized protein n=1 Tax=Aedes albopictus TaxID=7160 RepID=A0ABM1Y0K7_AEDAL